MLGFCTNLSPWGGIGRGPWPLDRSTRGDVGGRPRILLSRPENSSQMVNEPLKSKCCIQKRWIISEQLFNCSSLQGRTSFNFHFELYKFGSVILFQSKSRTRSCWTVSGHSDPSVQRTWCHQVMVWRWVSLVHYVSTEGCLHSTPIQSIISSIHLFVAQLGEM